MELIFAKKQKKLKDLRQGSLFLFEGSIALKSEYRNNTGGCLCYLEETGEYLWGGTNSSKDLNDLMVTPIKIKFK
jgi:hypothetical protein